MLMETFELPQLQIGKMRASLPIVQGGMGVGVSLSRLAAAVADEGGIGVIAANAIGMIEPDYFENGRAANIRALRKELGKARAATDGLIGVNLMVATNDFDELLSVIVEEKPDVVFLGAGLPLKGIPVRELRAANVAIAPIVSSARATKVIFSFWEKRYQDVPDAVILEGPKAGGHLGFSEEQIGDPAHALEVLLPEVVSALKPFEARFSRSIPVVAAGGIYSGDDIYLCLCLGAKGIQMGTRFVVTHECDADLRFKEAYLRCREEDLTLIKSPVGMIGRAIKNRFLEELATHKHVKVRCPWRCLESCDAKEAGYCISVALDNARRGNLDEGYAFAGANAYRTERILSVKELVDGLRIEFGSAVRSRIFSLREDYTRSVNGVLSLKGEYAASLSRLIEDYEAAFDQRVSGLMESANSYLCGLKESYDSSIRRMKDSYRARLDSVREEYERVVERANEMRKLFPEKFWDFERSEALF
jgi:NAD(P)H-dependent flavin oxidoreductase YrpB (nitropropane dioxygenase family)